MATDPSLVKKRARQRPRDRLEPNRGAAEGD